MWKRNTIMNNNYLVKKNVDKVKNGGYTYFINPNTFNEIKYEISSDEYNIYKPYPDSEKIMLYSYTIPKIHLFLIDSYFPLTHAEILGSLFGLNISDEVFGDIIIDGDKYYFYVIDEIYNFILDNFTMVGNKRIKLIEVPLDTLSDYHRKYEKLEFIVSSLRSDTVISRLIGTNRENIKDKIRKKEILVNYKILNNNSYIFREGDIFSIKRFGKYKFLGITKTKKDNYVICCYKYL